MAPDGKKNPNRSGPIDRAVLDLLAPTTADWYTLYEVEGPNRFRHVWVDQRASAMMGKPVSEMEGQLVADLFPKQVAARFHERANHAIAERTHVRYETASPTDANARRIEVTMSPILQGDSCTQLLVITRDVTARAALEEARDASERRLTKLMGNAPDLVWLIDQQGNILYATDATRRLLGYSPEELIGTNSFALVDPTDVPAMVEFFTQLLREPPGTPTRIELRTKHRDGSVLWTECTVTNMLDDPDVGAIVCNAHDVTERNRVLEQLAHHALHDNLTGLPTRFLLAERLNVLLTAATGHDRLAAAFFVDFDGFKLINDTLGHDAGDHVIREAARRLVEAVDDRGWVARFGGDEFVIAATRACTIDQHISLARDIRDILAAPFEVNGSALYLTASVGFAVGSRDTRVDAEALLRNADMAMYDAKRLRLPEARLFDDSLRNAAERRLETMNGLRTALENDEFVVHYQPVFDLPAGTPVGVEALLRWNHPTKGLVPPMEFIPIAEDTGLIVQIGEWVLNTSCRQIADWASRGFGRIQSSVNVSRKQLADPSFVQKVQAAIARSGIAPSMLTLEITEDLIMEDPAAAQAVLEQVTDLGVIVSIDDFGRGYSSLAFLSRFPAHQLKIDRMFVDQLSQDDLATMTRLQRRPGATLVGAIVEMAHALGLEVVAEGVETEDQLRKLRSFGCEYAQGFLLGRPAPAPEVEKILERRPSAIATRGASGRDETINTATSSKP